MPQKSETVSDLIEEIRNKLGEAAYGLHCFIDKWQHLQLGHFKRNRKSCEVLIEQDYAEAYSMVTNHSAMSTYWSDKTLQIKDRREPSMIP